MNHLSFSGNTTANDDVADLSDSVPEDDATTNQDGSILNEDKVNVANNSSVNNSTAGTPPAVQHHDVARSARKHKWLRLKKQVRGRDVFPFLETHNPQDPALLRLVIAEEPFRASYGMVEASWSDLANSLSAGVDDDGNPLFPHGVNHRVAQDRFNGIMKWYDREKTKVEEAYDPDDDNDAGPLERLRLVREAYTLLSAYEAGKKEGGGSGARDRGGGGEDENPRRDASVARRRVNTATALRDEKGDYKKRKLELMKRRIDNDSDVIAMKRAKQEARREERQQRLEVELEERRMQMKTQESLIKLIERMADK